MIGVVQVGTQAMADRYAYLPFVGLFIMVCWLVAELGCAKLHLSPVLLPAASVVVLLALALVSYRQVGFWSDHITLWTHVLEVTNNNWVAENNLGTALLKTGRMEEAIPHFRAAAALDPTDPNSTMNIGTYEQMHGNLPAAIELYRKAAEMARNPKVKARAYNNLAYAYKDTGDLADARDKSPERGGRRSGVCGRMDQPGPGGATNGRLAARPSDRIPRAMQIHPSDFGYLLLAGALEASGDQTQADSAGRRLPCSPTISWQPSTTRTNSWRTEVIGLAWHCEARHRISGPGSLIIALAGGVMNSVALDPMPVEQLQHKPRQLSVTLQTGIGSQSRSPRGHHRPVLPRHSPSLHQHGRHGIRLREPARPGGLDLAHHQVGVADV